MTCPSEAELARALSAGAEPPIAAHLATCAACRQAWEGARQTIELARELPVALPANARREEVRTAVLAAAAIVTRRPARRAWLAPVIAGAAAAALVGYLALPADAPPPAPARHAHGTVRPRPGARYLASSAGPDEIVRLTDGAIDVEVEPLLPGERFRVIVGGDEIEVRGTAFTVIAREGRLVGVAVARGRVDVRPEASAPAVLGTGQAWHAPLVAETAAPSPAITPPPSPGTTPPSPPSPAIPPPPSSPALPPPSSPAIPPPPPSSPAVPSSPSPSAITPPSSPAITSPPRMASAPRPYHAAVPAPPSPSHPATAPAPHPAATIAPPPVALVSHGEPAVPIDEAATPGDPAPTSPKPAGGPGRTPEELSYDQAWEALRTNHFARAASGFSRVLLLAPDSPLVEDASFWHAVALARGKRSAEALAAFRDFLDTYARSARAGEASAMLGWILIDARAYDEAARRFRAAAGDPSPAVRASAQAGLDALGQHTP